MEKQGIRFSTIYGGTDMLAAAISLMAGDKSNPDVVHPVPFMETQVVSTDGKVARKGEMGELLVRAPWLPGAYHKDEERSSSSYAQGWFRTGDIARLEGDGGLQILDRLRDVIKSGGEWIPSSIMESIISEVDGVASAAVVGRPDPKWGERPIAVVKLSKEVQSEAILGYLQRAAQEGRIMKWWVPEDVVFVADMPLTSVGKIDKKVLREKYASSASL